ncbi:MAG: Flp pilus assembly protein CpaB [Alphaproteobacteria bacterium]|nr:Flp pilus assembly protein CpaB [Alphaproteobacteria bacterium]MBN9569644.1 Flp pilus assembly protein CpaB [Alphaproteobacteria bacterium]
MDKRRLAVIGFAGLAAIAAIFLMRALLGGGTTKVSAEPAPKVATVQVLVANGTVAPGTKLSADMVRWQDWPKVSVEAGLTTHETVPDLPKFLSDAVARMPLVAGQPITESNVVHSESAGFMAASVQPGMRAVSIGISAETGAGGFILPNDRVDVVATDQISSSPRRFRSHTILQDVRVLSVDQTAKQEQGQKYVIGKTATLELTPSQALLVARAGATGQLSLALRSLASQNPKSPAAALAAEQDSTGSTEVSVIRYGIARVDPNVSGE